MQTLRKKFAKVEAQNKISSNFVGHVIRVKWADIGAKDGILVEYSDTNKSGYYFDGDSLCQFEAHQVIEIGQRVNIGNFI